MKTSPISLVALESILAAGEELTKAGDGLAAEIESTTESPLALEFVSNWRKALAAWRACGGRATGMVPPRLLLW